MPKTERPLSPHLSIYRPQISSVLSILHRLTGFALYIGLLVIAWYIILSIFPLNKPAAIYVSALNLVFASWFGKIILFAWLAAFYYHFCNGIRHLIWDTGRGFSIKAVQKTGLLILALTVFLTIFSWFMVISKITLA